MTTRRGFLAGLAAAAALPVPSWADAGSPAYLSAGKRGEGYVLHGLTEGGASLFTVPLPARGHAAAAHPRRPEAVAFARRPGTFALVLDCASGSVRHRLTPPEGRQFNGHGVFSEDGALLMTSEVVAETSEGRIGLWQGDGYRRVGEWASGGIGPHDIKRLADGRIVVANGGIATDPNDRTKLNIDTMRPNLTLLSPDGAVIDKAELDSALNRASIRHLALVGGTIAFGMQWEGDLAEPVPLVGLWTPERPPRLCPPRDSDQFVLQGYVGSIAASGDRIAVTSPRGGATMIFDGAGRPVATHLRADLCGVAARHPGAFLLTDGLGAVWSCDDEGLAPIGHDTTQWDNHLIALT